LKIDVNVPTIVLSKKNVGKNWKQEERAGHKFVNQWHGSEDPDPYQTKPHGPRTLIGTVPSYIKFDTSERI
jgi:hypothetical protein